MREKVYKGIKRTKEQIEEQHQRFSRCFKCDEELEPIKVPRIQPRMCNICRRNANYSDAELKQIPKKLQKANAKKDDLDEDLMFEDCPKAVAEYEKEKNVPHKWFSPVSGSGGSMLSSIMSTNPSNYKHKVGSAKDGYRYKRKDLN